MKMILESIGVVNFKNIEDAELKFCDKINCFVGDNAAGKTNFLDAIHYLSMSKSISALSDRQLVNHSKDFFMLSGKYRCSDSGEERVDCSYKNGSVKHIKRNDKEYKRISEHIGNFPVVVISPSDSEIINESGEERRKFLNQLICQIDRRYLNSLMKYNQLLEQRNALLKILRSPADHDILDVIDIQISEEGQLIHKKRREVIEVLTPKIKSYYSSLSGGKEQIEIEYSSKLSEKSMEELLKDNFPKDSMNQYTGVGIHRDDIKMNIEGYPARKFGSQGQQKSFIIALKLASFDVLSSMGSRTAILLLDDVFDKLDMDRVEGLISIVSSGNFGQIFVSDCNKLRLESVIKKITDNYEIFNIINGEA